ncbi:MAG TPA: CinA family protein [Anaerolineales bacterium]|nr:CinA family protein [Anaerolineales bacterium]
MFEEKNELLKQLFLEKNLTLSTAESCTGGLVASVITDISGSSSYFMGGVVSYSNDSKMKILGVSLQNIIDYGAVSEAVVVEMADGAAKQFDTNYSVSVSGIMGPTGGSPFKPVGLVWIGIHTPGNSFGRKYQFNGDRWQNKIHTVDACFDLLIDTVRNFK